ncbi:MAG: prepilin peptidase, partial [Nitrospira sp.]|nr:prepilin peptidase [Nitrospira sp.]
MVSVVGLIGLAISLILAAITDVREGRVPNWLTFSLAGFGIAVNTIYQGWGGFLGSIEGIALGILCLIFFYIKGGMGAGDVKLLGAIGAVMGPHLVVYVFGFAAIFGGLYSLAMLFAQGGLQYTWDRLVLLLNTLRCSYQVLTPQSHQPKE